MAQGMTSSAAMTAPEGRARTGAGEFAHGWRYALGAFVGIAGGFASLYFYASGLFIKPMAEAFGWTRGEGSLGAMAIALANVLALPIAGRLVDKVGAVRIAFLSTMALAVCFFLLATLTAGLASFLALVFLLTMLSSGSTAVTYNRIIVQYFRHHRGLALGLALTGTGVGAAAVPAFLTPFIADHGWRAGYMLLGTLAVPLGIMAALLLRGSEVRDGPGLPVGSWSAILRMRAFWTIAAIILLVAAAVLGTTMHLVPMLTDRGMSPATAGFFASVLGIAVIFARVFTGYLLDRFDAGVVTAALLLLAGAGMLLIGTGSTGLVLLGAVLIGFGLGTESDLLAFLLGRRVPLQNFGSAYGAIFGVHAAGVGLGGIAAGLLFDRTGSYTVWLWLAAGAMGLAALIALLTERKIAPIQ